MTTVLPPIRTAGLAVEDVADLAIRIREQMLATLCEISVKVERPEDAKSMDLLELTPEPSSTKISSGLVATDNIVPSIPAALSEETPSETSEPSRSVQSLRPDGSVSEYGETDDEGVVHIRRPIH